ncbi:hypothetical protein QUA20_23670, partial [Microcoleus sp. Pol7_A1]|uniref:hypothetical protein n=1 Tax=Microcoleus sp. Pol7_A1 TaxID=2818893 RepID=UPI002FD332E5
VLNSSPVTLLNILLHTYGFSRRPTYHSFRDRECKSVPTINPGRDTALRCPLYNSGATGNDIKS